MSALAQVPSPDEVELARASSRTFSVLLASQNSSQCIEISDVAGVKHRVTLPMSALRLFGEILVELAQGNAVSVIPIHAELTTQEAADLLCVSRPHLVQLIDKGEIPNRKVGTHRRVSYQAVMDYKQKVDSARLGDLDELSRQAQELNMGY